ncbi:MAG: 1-(5-phosphoribosyl)-5-((5-phosphoribosylamino)methylideneamino)imidazole-4-carboxamide isomerase [Gammaproteobacteria bacterium]|nr:MAG: 1-(5-phosphoribosyl)-5-((5-phosphoribosylamino)methylideneamino)imidazole-4-carboxamide isomerase [Gammaproteobacteria bacterium]
MPRPVDIRLHQQSRELEISFDDGSNYRMSCEYLRVHSPSAEVQGHGLDQAILQIGKEDVNITALDAVGNYAIRITFDDGHDTGLYTWPYLKSLGEEKAKNWARYLDRLREAGHEHADMNRHEDTRR